MSQINAARYAKLRKWMTTNTPEGWNETCNLAAIGCWMSWGDFDNTLDSLIEDPQDFITGKTLSPFKKGCDIRELACIESTRLEN